MKCIRCATDLPETDFHKSTKWSSGFRQPCKHCRATLHHANYRPKSTGEPIGFITAIACSQCGEIKAVDAFHRGHTATGRRQPCRLCRSKELAAKAAAKEATKTCKTCGSTDLKKRTRYCGKCKYQKYRINYSKKYHRRRRYNLSQERFDAMMMAQNGACAICKRSDKRLVIDHCHNSNIIRGLLCDKCNTTVGRLEENFAVTISTVEYIKAFLPVIQ